MRANNIKKILEAFSIVVSKLDSIKDVVAHEDKAISELSKKN